MTVNDLVTLLATMKRKDPDVGKMRVVDFQHADIVSVVIRQDRDNVVDDDDFVMVIE